MAKIDKLAVIRNKIETCFDPEEKEIALNLCAALDYAKQIITACQTLEKYAKSDECIENVAKIDAIIEKGKNGKGN